MDIPTTNILEKKDYKYVVERPDSGFSPERNKALVESTIKDTEKYFRSISGPSDKDEEVADVMSDFAVYKFGRGGQKKIKDYLGQKNYEKLVGEDLVAKIRAHKANDQLARRQGTKVLL